jgi:hypothetical protein
VSDRPGGLWANLPVVALVAGPAGAKRPRDRFWPSHRGPDDPWVRAGVVTLTAEDVDLHRQEETAFEAWSRELRERPDHA